jgi:hypothetical protein
MAFLIWAFSWRIDSGLEISGLWLIHLSALGQDSKRMQSSIRPWLQTSWLPATKAAAASGFFSNAMPTAF